MSYLLALVVNYSPSRVLGEGEGREGGRGGEHQKQEMRQEGVITSSERGESRKNGELKKVQNMTSRGEEDKGVHADHGFNLISQSPTPSPLLPPHPRKTDPKVGQNS